jgi:hypothetical protein
MRNTFFPQLNETKISFKDLQNSLRSSQAGYADHFYSGRQRSREMTLYERRNLENAERVGDQASEQDGF